MSVVFNPDTKETRKRFQELARHQMILRLEADILADMKVCEIEGWDKTEYIRQLQSLINGFNADMRGEE